MGFKVVAFHIGAQGVIISPSILKLLLRIVLMPCHHRSRFANLFFPASQFTGKSLATCLLGPQGSESGLTDFGVED